MRRELWEIEARRYSDGQATIKAHAIGGDGSIETSNTGRGVLAPARIAKVVAALLYATPVDVKMQRKGTGPDNKYCIVRAVMERG